MTKDELMPLLSAFAARYGEKSMSKELFEMWVNNVGHLEHEHVASAMNKLIGSRDRPFGWQAVTDLIASMYPDTTEQSKLQADWKDNQVSQTDREKKFELAGVMTNLVDENEKSKKRREDIPEWVTKYAHKFVKIWGPVSARKIITDMKSRTERGRNSDGDPVVYETTLNKYQFEFVNIVNKILMSDGNGGDSKLVQTKEN